MELRFRGIALLVNLSVFPLVYVTRPFKAVYSPGEAFVHFGRLGLSWRRLGYDLPVDGFHAFVNGLGAFECFWW